MCIRDRHRASYEREMVRTHLLAASGAAKALAEISTGEDWWEAVMIRRVQSALGERSFPAELLFARRLRGRACLGFREVATLPLGKVEEQLRQLMEEEVGLRLEPARREEGVLVFDELAPWRVEGGWAARALEAVSYTHLKRMVKRLGRRVLLPVAFWLAVWELCYRAVGQDLLLASQMCIRDRVHPGQSGDRNASLSGNRGAVRAGRAPHEACGAGPADGGAFPAGAYGV